MTEWTEEQKALLLHITNNYKRANNTQIGWRKAFDDHPEWEAILLAGGRPFFHLWHASKSLLKGVVPDNLYAAKKEQKRANSAARYQRMKKLKAREVKPHKPHHMSREGRALRAAAAAREIAAAANGMPTPPKPMPVATKPVAPIRHCPDCGCDLTPYNRAKELTHG